MRTRGIAAFLTAAFVGALSSWAAAEVNLPSDTHFCGQWNLHNSGGDCEGASVGTYDADVDAPQAWDVMQGVVNAEPTVIAFLDNGYAYTHPDLTLNLWVNEAEDKNDNGQFDSGLFGDINNVDEDGNGYTDDVIGFNFTGAQGGLGFLPHHGTTVASIVTAQTDYNPPGGQSSQAGLCSNHGAGIWTVQAMIVKVNGFGWDTTEAHYLQGMTYAADNGAGVISCSLMFNGWQGLFGGEDPLFFLQKHPSILEALLFAQANDALVVHAAGHDSFNVDDDSILFHYPKDGSGVDNLLVVTSSDRNDRLARYPYDPDYPLFGANFGRDLVHLAAPGDEVSAIWDAQTVTTLQIESSHAAAHVSGAAALLRAKHPDWNYASVKEAILRSAEFKPALFRYVVTSGRLNTWYALRVTPGVDSDGDGILDLWDDTEVCAPQTALCAGEPGCLCNADGLPPEYAGCRDNCPQRANPCQEDSDGDGVGDACDADIDGDGLPNSVDFCPFDHLDDVAHEDGDFDEIGDGCDNCPELANFRQLDDNLDGFGDICQDADGDGHTWYDADWALVDCDDFDPDVHPEAEEVCNGKDDNCAAGIDENCPGDCEDLDEDGFSTPFCEDPAGIVDCDDSDPEVHPDAAEDCLDGVDNDCDGLVDLQQGWCCQDKDSDNFFIDGPGCELGCDCAALGAGVADCDDGNYFVNAGADEKCNGLDDDCDGQAAEWEMDGDGDGYMVCAGDCDDDKPYVAPNVSEDCEDGHDNDCDGLPDEYDLLDCPCPDKDEDGHESDVCGGDDCDDSDEALVDLVPCVVFDDEAGECAEAELCVAECPGNPFDIACDGIDQDCDGADFCTCLDSDGDGFGEGDGCDGPDCDDDDDELHEDLLCLLFSLEEGECVEADVCTLACPANPEDEVCDGLDQDCDGEDFCPCEDQDGDGFGEGAGCDGPDCDDADDEVYEPLVCSIFDAATGVCLEADICAAACPDADDDVPCDGTDQDCSGEDYCPCEDKDGDGYGDGVGCKDADCDDDNSEVWATVLCPDFDDDANECLDEQMCVAACPENPVIDECGGEIDYNCDGKISCTSSATSGKGADDGCGCRTGLPGNTGPSSGVWFILAALAVAFLRRRLA